MKLNYRNPELLLSKTPCIFKMWAGNSYYIWKTQNAKALIQTVVETQIAKEIEVPKLDSIFSKLVEFCRDKKVKEISIEILKNYPGNELKLLQDEYDLLQAAKKDKKCLNKEFVNHKSYPRWISQEVINNFKIYYTKGKNVGSSVKDKNLRKFLNTLVKKNELDPPAVEKIYEYIKTRYK